MKRDIEFRLAERYPFFVPEALADFVSGDPTNGGCAHEDGWYNILESLFVALASLGLPADFKLVQVKEKYGVLRVHDNGQYGEKTRTVNALYVLAAEESSTICEVCGQPGRIRHDARVRTLCDQCYKK